MATFQDTFPLRNAIGVVGMRCNTEPENVISRTLESAAGCDFGQPLYRGSDDHGAIVGGTFAATGAGSARSSGNVGTGVITASPAVASPAKQGRYRVVLTATGATAPFIVFDPEGVPVGNGVVATPATVDGIGPFTLSNAGTMTAGDTWYIDVTYTANAKLLGFQVIDPSVPAIATNPDRLPQYATASIMNLGMLWVMAGASVADGDQAYWNPATKRYTNSSAHILLPGCIFDTTATDGNLARLSIRKRIQ